jgi:glycylpeptide N-tetradecanoyltransferase
VRASKSRKLVAFISGVPVSLRVRSTVLKSTEINFLCVHKKLRRLRLAPVLIAEITRRCNLFGIYQAIYTAGIVLPKPVSSCRYMHRPLDWLKLYDVGFSALPPHSTKSRQVTRNFLPSATSSVGLRPAQKKDVPAITSLLARYLKKFAMAVEFTEEEVSHWLLHDEATTPEQVIWSYVVEDPSSHKITDFFSFYVLESAVIGNAKHRMVRAAYLFYYATEAAFQKEEKVLKERLNLLINDALILAKRVSLGFFICSGFYVHMKKGMEFAYMMFGSSASTSSTPSRSWTTRCSSKRRNSVSATGSCISTSTTTGRCLYPVEWIRRIWSTLAGEGVWGW